MTKKTKQKRPGSPHQEARPAALHGGRHDDATGDDDVDDVDAVTGDVDQEDEVRAHDDSQNSRGGGLPASTRPAVASPTSRGPRRGPSRATSTTSTSSRGRRPSMGTRKSATMVPEVGCNDVSAHYHGPPDLSGVLGQSTDRGTSGPRSTKSQPAALSWEAADALWAAMEDTEDEGLDASTMSDWIAEEGTEGLVEIMKQRREARKAEARAATAQARPRAATRPTAEGTGKATTASNPSRPRAASRPIQAPPRGAAPLDISDLEAENVSDFIAQVGIERLTQLIRRGAVAENQDLEAASRPKTRAAASERLPTREASTTKVTKSTQGSDRRPSSRRVQWPDDDDDDDQSEDLGGASDSSEGQPPERPQPHKPKGRAALGEKSSSKVTAAHLSQPHHPAQRYGRKDITPASFDGRSPWPPFKAEFERCVEYNGWGEFDCRVQLQQALRDGPRQMVWAEGKGDLTYAQLMAELEKRYGPQMNCNQYKAELAARHRRRGETTDQLSLEISKLTALAYPGVWDARNEAHAVDALMRAIGDRSLDFHMRQKHGAPTLAEATAYVKNYEVAHGTAEASDWDATDPPRRKTAKVNEAVLSAVGSDAKDSARDETMAAVLEQLAALSAEMKEIKKCPPWGRERWAASQNRRPIQLQSGETRTCFNCGQPGHLRNDCPQPRKPRQASSKANTVPG